MQTILFFSRLGLYFLLVSAPLWLEPAVVVAYDSAGAAAWFFLAPLQMLLAYYLHPSRLKSKNIWLGPLFSLLAALLFLLLFSGWEGDSVILYLCLSFFPFVLTRLIFFSKGTPVFAALEVFFFGFVYFGFLSFTRSAPEIAEQNPALAKTLLFLTFFSFLFHTALIYLAAFPDRSFLKKRTELLALVCILLPVFIFLALISPRDFVEHEIAFNEWNEKPPPKPKELDKGEGTQEKEEEEENNRNGLPLGKRDEKYPTELQGSAKKQKKHQDGDKSKKDKSKEEGSDGQGSESQGSNNGKKSGSGPRLEGVPADQWKNYSNSQGGKSGKQNAVMIAASQFSPVYAARKYLGAFGEKALTPSSVGVEPLNKLSGMHLIETWQEPITSRDDKREIRPVFFLSTIKDRVMPYRPYRIQPTIQDVVYHPFDLSYHVQSRISVSQPEDWLLVREINEFEKGRLKHYLELKLSEKMKKSFTKHLKWARRHYIKIKEKDKSSQNSGSQNPQKYFEKIDAILHGFKRHRYELGFDENINLQKIHTFLSKEKKGDCTEFSQTSALLGRFAGVPSRVVVGYLASRDLQTPAHRGGLYHLRKRIPLLHDYSLKELYLITTSHHHAWVQFWIPNFGWVDFETTSFAIPPKPEMDPNNMDVVIPMIDERLVMRPSTFEFPWLLTLGIFLRLIFFAIILLYIFSFLRWTFYWLGVNTGFYKRSEEKGLKALQKLLLMRLSHEGQPLMPRHKTILEYSEEVPALKEFAELYTMLRFREHYENPQEKTESAKKLKAAYHKSIHSLRRKGFFNLIVRAFHLRNLCYS